MFPMGRISDYSHPIKNITVSHNNSLTNSEQSKGILVNYDIPKELNIYLCKIHSSYIMFQSCFI